jgi:hypothetical protein
MLMMLCLMMLAPLHGQQLSGTTSEARSSDGRITGGGIVVEPGGGRTQWGNVNVTLSLNRSHIELNDLVAMSIRVNRDSYLFVYTTDEKGVTRQLVPNFYDTNNLVAANSVFRVPSGSYQLRASTPGWQRITVHAVATNGEAYWRPNPRLMRLSAENPFPVVPMNEAGLKSGLRTSVEQGWATESKSRRGGGLSSPGQGQLQGGGIIVQPPGSMPTSPGWGEASARLFVSSTGLRQTNTQGTTTRRNPDSNRPKPGKDSAELRITSSPAGAELYLDNYFYGSTPITVDIPPEFFRIQVKKSGYRTWERQKQFKKGEKESFSVRLQQE